jgi:hypothetical protein
MLIELAVSFTKQSHTKTRYTEAHSPKLLKALVPVDEASDCDFRKRQETIEGPQSQRTYKVSRNQLGSAQVLNKSTNIESVRDSELDYFQVSYVVMKIAGK